MNILRGNGWLLILLVACGVGLGDCKAAANADPVGATDGSILVDTFIQPADAGDETAAINRALQYATEHQVHTIRFGAKTYHIRSKIICEGVKDLSLVGAVKADGMPGTIIEEHLKDSSDPWYEPLTFNGCSDIAVRNLAFNCSKPVAMVARIVELGDKSVTVEALPRYQDATELKGRAAIFKRF